MTYNNSEELQKIAHFFGWESDGYILKHKRKNYWKRVSNFSDTWVKDWNRLIRFSREIIEMKEYEYSPCDFHNLTFKKEAFYQEILTFINWYNKNK